MKNFPCKECLVKVVCSATDCYKLITNTNELTILIKNHQKCPDCSNNSFQYIRFCGGDDIRCIKCKHVFEFNQIENGYEFRRLDLQGVKVYETYFTSITFVDLVQKTSIKKILSGHFGSLHPWNQWTSSIENNEMFQNNN